MAKLHEYEYELRSSLDCWRCCLIQRTLRTYFDSNSSYVLSIS
jgi:hypothetical protein